MKQSDDFSNRKEDRRQKLKNKTKKHHDNYDEENDKSSKIKHEIKKIKQNLEDEEWEDWDRYYNH